MKFLIALLKTFGVVAMAAMSFYLYFEAKEGDWHLMIIWAVIVIYIIHQWSFIDEMKKHLGEAMAKVVSLVNQNMNNAAEELESLKKEEGNES